MHSLGLSICVDTAATAHESQRPVPSGNSYFGTLIIESEAHDRKQQRFELPLRTSPKKYNHAPFLSDELPSRAEWHVSGRLGIDSSRGMNWPNLRQPFLPSHQGSSASMLLGLSVDHTSCKPKSSIML